MTRRTFLTTLGTVLVAPLVAAKAFAAKRFDLVVQPYQKSLFESGRRGVVMARHSGKQQIMGVPLVWWSTYWKAREEGMTQTKAVVKVMRTYSVWCGSPTVRAMEQAIKQIDP